MYEYPCEVVQLSPALSEPQLWSNYMDDCSGSIDYFTYAHQLSDVASNFPTEIDGFSVSSSSRPFHSSNVAQMHNTWPHDATEFSWSQIQVWRNFKVLTWNLTNFHFRTPPRKTTTAKSCSSSLWRLNGRTERISDATKTTRMSDQILVLVNL